MSASTHDARLSTQWVESVRKLSPNLPLPHEGTTPRAWALQHNIPDDVQVMALANVLDVEICRDLDAREASKEFMERIPIDFARRHRIMGFRSSADDSVVLAISNLESWSTIDVVSRFLNRRVVPVVALEEQISSAINRAFEQRTGQAQAVIESLDAGEVMAEIAIMSAREDLLDVDDRAPVIRLINMVMFEAVMGNASDVHFQPYEKRFVVRFRIDGVLFDAFTIPKNLQEEAVTRIKVIGRMDIAERRLPQDGRSTVRVGDRIIDLRIASLPTSYGERVVVRLLDKSARSYRLDDLGMPSATLEQFRRLIQLEHGLILVTGPTGSGKSTTMYAALGEINSTDRNVITLEDPIEYQLDGISQTQINEKKGMTFASGLRHVLRQDPDIIMVGEIRDRETAMMAIQSALTGHLVFSTLHTNDAASAVTRLFDLGVEPYLVSSSLVGVMAQRLVRQICKNCKTLMTPQHDDRLQTLVGEPLTHIQRFSGAGCSVCRQTGYRGRVGLFELLEISDRVGEEIQIQSGANEIRKVALDEGMCLLSLDGYEKIRAGITSVEEIMRVTMRTGDSP